LEEEIYEVLVSLDNGSTYTPYGDFTSSELSDFETMTGGTKLTCDGETVTNMRGTGVKCITHEIGETYQSTTNEACAIFNGEEVCLKPNDYANKDSYYTRMNNLGLACNDYQNENKLQCSNGSTYNESGSLSCRVDSDGSVGCGFFTGVGGRCSASFGGIAACH
jgi:hypothetical protein